MLSHKITMSRLFTITIEIDLEFDTSVLVFLELLLEDQSDQGLQCLLFCPHYCMMKFLCSNFKGTIANVNPSSAKHNNS